MNHDLLPDLLLAVEQQLSSAQTPYVRKTFDRLLKSGLTEDEVRKQIAVCLGEQMDEVFRTKRSFDENAYKEALKELPFAIDECPDSSEEE